jgi:hypothetical protein
MVLAASALFAFLLLSCSGSRLPGKPKIAPSPPFEIAHLLVRFDHVASVIIPSATSF